MMLSVKPLPMYLAQDGRIVLSDGGTPFMFEGRTFTDPMDAAVAVMLDNEAKFCKAFLTHDWSEYTCRLITQR